MSVYRRPVTSDELYHWGKGTTSKNHKYIDKIGNRYFYTMEELQAYKQGATNKVGQTGMKLRSALTNASHSFDRSRQAAINKIGGAKDRIAKALQSRKVNFPGSPSNDPRARVTKQPTLSDKINGVKDSANKAVGKAINKATGLDAKKRYQNADQRLSVLMNNRKQELAKRDAAWTNYNKVPTGGNGMKTQMSRNKARANWKKAAGEHQENATNLGNAQNNASKIRSKAQREYLRSPVGIADSVKEKISEVGDNIQNAKKKKNLTNVHKKRASADKKASETRRKMLRQYTDNIQVKPIETKTTKTKSVSTYHNDTYDNSHHRKQYSEGYRETKPLEVLDEEYNKRHNRRRYTL